MLPPQIFAGHYYLASKWTCEFNVPKLKRSTGPQPLGKIKTSKYEWSRGCWAGDLQGQEMGGSSRPQHQALGPESPDPSIWALYMIRTKDQNPASHRFSAKLQVPRRQDLSFVHRCGCSACSQWLHRKWIFVQCTPNSQHRYFLLSGTFSFPVFSHGRGKCAVHDICSLRAPSAPHGSGQDGGPGRHSGLLLPPVWKSDFVCPARCCLCNMLTRCEMASHVKDTRHRGHQTLQN